MNLLVVRDYGIELHDFLDELSLACPIKLYDNEGNILFDGYSGVVLETSLFSGFNVDSYCFDNDNMILWIY